MVKPVLVMLCISLYMQAGTLPGMIIGYHAITNIPLVDLDSLDIANYEVIKTFNLEDLQQAPNWQENQQHMDYFSNR